jgi:hypothetical protein
MPITPNEPECWHKRTEQARVLAAEYSDEMAKATMLRVAEDCDKLSTSTGPSRADWQSVANAYL